MSDKKITKKIGQIVSVKNQNTAVVLVESFMKHPVYHKSIRSTRKFHAQNPDNKYQLGQKVEIAETRPVSKLKHWIILREV